MKNQNFGKPLSRLITMVAICMLSLNAMAYDFSYTYQGKTLYYNITSSNTVEVADCSDNMSGDVVIPSSVTNNGTTYSVTSVGNSAFSYCSGLTSISIPNSVTSIGSSAFWGCSGLTSATIPESVTSIGNSAFSRCSSLTSVSIPNSVTLIGRSTFSGCSSLTSVTIPNSITSIEQDAFWGCSSLTSVTIPNSVTSIGRSTFSGCSSLTSVTIGNSVTSIGNSAFYECSSLTSVTIPNGITSIGNSAFANCSSLTSVSIGNNVTSIGERAFQECSSLTTLNFNAVNCSDFSSGTFHPFYSCPISTINVSNDVQRIPAGFASGLSALTSVTIPNSVTSIDNEAFAHCYSLTSITIPNSVTSIEYRVFYFCYNLTSITIPNSVTSIGNEAFSGCSNLTSITIPNSVTSIGNEAFSGCSNLTSITIPNSVTSIGYYAFEYCRGLTSIISNAILPPVTSSSFPSNNSCNVTVPCGSLEAYTSSLWNNYFPNRITEGDVFDVSVAANDDSFGSVSVESQSCSVKVITATPSNCKSFAAWNDGNTDNPRTITVTSDTSFTAIFESVELSHSITAAICEGTAYTENGFNVSEAGVYTQNLQTINGCDSTVTLTLTVNPVATTNLTAAICEGTVYTENGFNASEAGVYTQNLQTINGCDSTVTLTLTVNPVATTTLQVAICDGSTYTENGFNVSEAGVYTQNLQTINGCDSTVTLTLTVNPVATTNLTAEICEGTAYTENGFNVSEAGVYTQNLQTVNGCDSTVTLTLVVNPVATTNLTAAICEGTVYAENGFNVSEAGVYTQNLQTINGCDSTVTLTLSVNPIATTNLTAAICEGISYIENGFNVSEAGVYTQNLQTVNGCDSTVTLTLVVNPVATTNLTAAICEGTAYTENGFNVTEAGVYTQNLQTINGCDSTVTLTLSVNPVATTTLQAAICEGTAYTENGFNVSEAGVYTQNLQTVNGCDSTVTLTLVVNPVATTNLTAAICEGTAYTDNGFNVSEAGVYTQNLQTINGCDSTVTLTLTVNPVATTTLQAAICEGIAYTENGFNVSEAGVYTQNLQTINGCDSTVTLTLTVNPIATTNLTAAICEGTAYTENGFNVSEAGVYTQNLQTVNGCDSTVTLTLTVNPVATTNLTAAICEGTAYTENGFNVSEAGVYTQNLQTINGCDSTVTLTLVVNPIATTTLQAAICEGTAYTENGFNVSEAGVYTQNLQTINGCDSIVTLTLLVNPIATTTLQAAICEGSVYTDNGFNVSEAGVYTQNLQTINGCDSTVTLTLVVNPIATTNLTAAICEGTAYTENGFNVSEAGVYTQNLQTINGCDSIVTLTLLVNPIATTTLQAAICEGSVYTDNGFNVSEAGVYTQNLQTINGCDSTVTLTLSVNPVATTTLQAAICEGSVYTDNGFNVCEAGVYTQNLQTINGCDSTVTLTLVVNPIATTNLTAAICEGTAYTENGFNVSEAGVYTQNLQTVNGCDSIVTLTLTVNPVYNITIDATINQGDVYQENGFEVSEAGVYTQNLQTVNGCDSVIVLNLTVNSSLGDVVANSIEVALYPNPAESYTILKVQGLKEQTKVALFDVRGRKLREFDLVVGTETLRLDLRDLPGGVYTLMIGNTTKKLIVE